MEDKYRQFFQTEGDVAGLDWVAEAFFQTYSRYFANEDYYLDEAGDYEALLRPLRQTIEIADDDLSMTWEDFIQYQTGYPLEVPGVEVISFQMARAMHHTSSLTYQYNVAHSHWHRTFRHAPKKNRLAQQSGVILHLVGHYGHPLTDGEAANDGGSFDINKLTNRDDWLIKSMDPTEDLLGKLSASEASINLFFGGDTYIPNTTLEQDDVFKVEQGNIDSSILGADKAGLDTLDAEAPQSSGTDGTADGDPKAGSGGRFWVEANGGISVLSGISFT